MKLSNIPVKGTADWMPDEYNIRGYIFSIWRQVCTSFGYEEYLTPLLEYADLYRAKSGEDVGGKELMIMTDRAGRELVIRPEMTPSVTRLVSRIYPQSVKPLRYFSIANFVRNEKPQRGRNREFWQLNFDIFGSQAVQSDIEIARISIDILRAFNPPTGSYLLKINHRGLIDFLLTDILSLPKETHVPIIRLLDKYEKLTPEDFGRKLVEVGVSDDSIGKIREFIGSETLESLLGIFPAMRDTKAMQELQICMEDLRRQGYGDEVTFSPAVLRGFDYYTGIVFEMFDTNPVNTRSMFGGGRYNGLAALFGGESFPAVGCAPGDEPMYLFLESWGLLDDIRKKSLHSLIYIPLLGEQMSTDVLEVVRSLRAKGFIILEGGESQSIGKALEFANKKKCLYTLLYGDEEKVQSSITVKNMVDGNQTTVKIAEVAEYISGMQK